MKFHENQVTGSRVDPIWAEGQTWRIQ